MVKNIPYVVNNTPSNHLQLSLVSTKEKGVDILIPRPSVEEKYSVLNEYTKFIVKGITDRGDMANIVMRTREDNPDEIQILELEIKHI